MNEARIRASIEAYVAAWNERDAAQRMRLIEQACAEDLHMRTPGKRIDGRAQLDALIADFQDGARESARSSRAPSTSRATSFAIPGSSKARRSLRGDTLDVGECDEDGRIRLLLTFVGAALPSRTELGAIGTVEPLWTLLDLTRRGVRSPTSGSSTRAARNDGDAEGLELSATWHHGGGRNGAAASTKGDPRCRETSPLAEG